MRHDIRAKGYAFGLRPVDLPDSQFIVDLRNDPRTSAFIRPGARTASEQRSWLLAYLERPDDYLFVVERLDGAQAEGIVSIYDIEARAGEMGRWVLKPGSLAAAESARHAYHVAFEALGLTTVYTRTIRDNRQVVSFHDRSGLVRTSQRRDVLVGDRSFDVVEHCLTKESWPATRRRLDDSARQAAALLERGRRPRGKAGTT